jgi:hypothetical protein
MGVFLFLIFLSTILYFKGIQYFYVYFIALTAAVLSDLLFLKIRKIKFFFPSAALVTGSIIGLISSPNWDVIILACVLAMASKNFLRLDKKHVFNPAAFGLFFSHFLFKQDVSWWASSWQTLEGQFSIVTLVGFLILLLPGIISAYRMRRYINIFIFFITYNVLNWGVSTILDPTLIFFSLVMLPEPMTTPIKPPRQFAFGLVVMALVWLLGKTILPDIFIPALLLGNLIFFKFK